MKSICRILLAVFMILQSPVAWSQISAVGPNPAVSGAAQIGVAAAVRGTVKIVPSGKAGRIVTSGEPVYIGDHVTTDEKGQLQIMLLDETVFTLGPNTDLVIDEFVYDPSTQDGKVTASVGKGIFRFVTGKIARKKPENVDIKLPVGSVGIRGTIVLGQITGPKSFVVLLGPGEKNNTGNRIGRMLVRNEVNGKSRQTLIAKTGFGSTIEGKNMAPSNAFKVPLEQIQQMTQSLNPPPAPGKQSSGGGTNESASEEAGQDAVDASGDAGDTGTVANTLQMFADESVAAAQDAADTAGGIADGITKWKDLTTVLTGLYHFSQSNVPFIHSSAGAGDDYDITFNIDFGARTVGGGSSGISYELPSDIGGGNIGNFSLSAQSFQTGVGDASFSYTQEAGSAPIVHFNVQIDLINEAGQVAVKAAHSVTAWDEALPSDTTSGSGVAERFEGLAY